MLLSIIGAAVIIAGAILIFVFHQLLYLLLFLVGAALIIMSSKPLCGYDPEQEFVSYELVPLISNTEIYVLEDDNCVLTYKYVKCNGEKVIASSIDTYTVYKQFDDGEECYLKPTMVVEYRRPTKNIWISPTCGYKWKNVLYVPKDSIVR